MARAGLAVPARRAKSASPSKRSTSASGASCEQLSFNPWHALADHRPLGDFNRARRSIYDAMAAFRRDRL